ncbi:MAG: hypothetical protein JKY48_09445 [Flavobacteriales bacterium]|nr:hypothetical protein [Flavobacteriales bacterium]
MEKKILSSFILGLLLLQILLVTSCEQKEQVNSNTEEILSKTLFDNDSAKADLLAQYIAETVDQYDFKLKRSIEEKDIAFESIHRTIGTYCAPCHYKGGNAPFSLTTYSSIKKRAKAIKDALLSNLMPPWKADNSYNQYHNSQAMPDSLKEQIIHWINQGAKAESTSKNEINYSLLEKPTIVLSPSLPFTLRSNEDDYVCNIIDPKFEIETYVEAFTFESDNIDIIHHYTLFADTTGKYLDSKNNWSCKKDSIFKHMDLIDTWAKGIRFIKYEKGLAYRFPKETKFLLQTHYSGYGNKGKSESCTMSLYTSSEKPINEVKWSVLNKTDIFIPANKTQTDDITWKLTESVTLLGVVPHMHYLGQKMEIFAISPEGKKLPIVFIPDWSYTVQSKYMLKEPLFIPEGSMIYTNVVYDNTSNNPEQPNDPIKDVIYAQSSYDEMLAIGFYYVQNGQNNLPEPTVIFIK